MVSTKHCLYPGCHNDTRNNFKDHMKGVFFLPFPKPKSNLLKCMRWLQACGKNNPDSVKKYWYVCCKHFVGANGPTPSHPDPISSVIIPKTKFFVDEVIELGWSYGKEGKSKIFTKTSGGKQLLQLIWNDLGELQVRVLNTSSFLSRQHFLWKTVPCIANTDSEILYALQMLNVFKVCKGSPEPKIRDVFNTLPPGSLKTGVECNDVGDNPCVRSATCTGVVPLGLNRIRCIPCTRYRMYLQCTKNNEQKRNLAKVQKLPKKSKIKNLKEFFSQRAFDNDSFNKIFQEQKLRNSLAKNKYGYKWHPDILEWCQHLKAMSTSSYETLRESGVVPLPSLETLTKKSEIYSKPGFSNEQFLDLKDQMDKLGDDAHHKYVSLIWDEVKIKDKVDYSHKAGQVIGLLPNSSNSNALVKESIATHLFQVVVRGITSDLKFSLAFFPSKVLESSQIFDIIWECVEKLELIGVKVIAFVSDGTLANRTFFQKCSSMESENYRVLNKYALDEIRYIYFISDVPHLIKTTRNCFSNSGFHLKTRNLWKNGKNISWNHIVDLYKKTSKSTLGVAQRLSFSHVFLNSYSKMRVKLAVQVLSNTVAAALESENNTNLSETITFIRMFNNFFDLMNTKHLEEEKSTINPNKAVFTSVDDPRLKWLEEDFLNYLNDWETDVRNRNGQFTSEERDKMLLSFETREGLIQSIHSVVAIVKFLLTKDAPFVLTNHLNQYPLEQEYNWQKSATSSNINLTFSEYTKKFINIQVVRPIIKKYKRMRKAAYIRRKH